MNDTDQRPVLVVDFGAQYAQLIARRVREARVYSEVVPHSMPAEQILAKQPRAIILSGGPSSVYAEGAPRLDPALLEAGVPELRIANRTRIRAEQIKAEFGAKIVVYDWAQLGNMLEGAATVVNGTALGMEGRPPLRLPLDALAPGTLVTDLVYTPLRTAFLEDAAARGAITVDGLGMLLHQAAPGFERWFGRRPEVDEAARAAVRA